MARSWTEKRNGNIWKYTVVHKLTYKKSRRGILIHKRYKSNAAKMRSVKALRRRGYIVYP